ncbi:MAG TPA: calcium-binding protein [Rhizomicrobium sp.]|jgi:Ca2+-binding RTX toxin-like protein
MTTHFITANILNASTDGIDLGSGDQLFIASGITVAGGTNGSAETGASSASGGISAQILGTLWGESNGLDFYGSAGVDTVFVGTGASVIGVTGTGISLSGNGDIVTNNGEISATTALSGTLNAGVSLYGSGGTVTNNGTISGNFGVFFDAGGDILNNSGTIDATNDGVIAVTPDAGVVDMIDNSGTIRTSQSAAITASNEGAGSIDITNSGHIVGYIALGDGPDSYDGTLGSVTRGVFGEGGNDVLLGGAGSEYLDGGTGSDVINGGGGNDTLLAEGTSAVIDGGDGNDTISMGPFLTTGDLIDGGSGKDNLILSGDYSAGFVFAADTMTNVEKLTLGAGFSYKLTMSDGNVAAGERLTVDASALTATETLKFNGVDEHDGYYVITGGLANDTLVGGDGNDTITGGAGDNWITGGGGADHIIATATEHDRFIYTDVSDSTGVAHDTITGFNGSYDKLDLDVTVTAVDATVASGRLSTSSFDTNLTAALTSAHLAAGHAVLFTPTIGNYSGHTLLVIDANGIAGYQAGQDYVIDITGATNLTHLTTATFI